MHRVLMRAVLVVLMGALCLPTLSVYAGDTHFDDETHLITFVLKDSNGSFVSGDTVRLTVRSSDNVNYFDFNDDTWDTFSNIITKHRTMTEDLSGHFYWTTFTVDNTTIVSGDLTFIVSVDTASVKTIEVRSVSFSNLNNLIKIHR